MGEICVSVEQYNLMVKRIADQDAQLAEAQARIKELEKELKDQARLNGMGSEREAKLMGQLQATQKKLAMAEAMEEERDAAINTSNAFRSELLKVKTRLERAEVVLEKYKNLKAGPTGHGHCLSGAYDGDFPILTGDQHGPQVDIGAPARAYFEKEKGGIDGTR